MLKFNLQMQNLILFIFLIIGTQAQAISLQMPTLNFGDVFVYEISPYMGYSQFSEDIISMKYIRQETNENGDFYVFEETSQNTKQMTLRKITKKLIEDQHTLWARTYQNAKECKKYADSTNSLGYVGVSEGTASYLFFNGHFDSFCLVATSGDATYGQEAHGPIPGPYPISKGDTSITHILERPEPYPLIQLVGYTLSKPNLQIIGNEESEVMIAATGVSGDNTIIACKNGMIGTISIEHSDKTNLEGAPCIKRWELKQNNKSIYSDFVKPYLSIEKIQSFGQIKATSTFGTSTFSSMSDFKDMCLVVPRNCPASDGLYNTYNFYDLKNPTVQNWLPVYSNTKTDQPNDEIELILVQSPSDQQVLANSVCTASFQRPATGESLIVKTLEKNDLCYGSNKALIFDNCGDFWDVSDHAFEFSLTTMGEITSRRPLELGSMYIKSLKCSIDD